MNIESLKTSAEAILGDGVSSPDRRRLVYEFGAIIAELEGLAESAAPETQDRASDFVAFLQEKLEEHGSRFFQEAFLLNLTAEAMARSHWLSASGLRFLSTGLYSYGLSHIERCHRDEAVAWMAAHAELVEEFGSRRRVKETMDLGRDRIEEGRPFCLVHLYLNELRKRYWAAKRASRDAVDVSLSIESVEHARQLDRAVAQVEDGPATTTPLSSADRVGLMIRIFGVELSDLQQRIYLARHPVAVGALLSAGTLVADELRTLAEEARREDVADRLTWPDLGARLGMNEKSAKREYLRALLALLKGASDHVFGEHAGPSFVRRVQDSLRAAAQERDLKLRDGSGRGLGKIVERWEIALRLVLNNEPQGVGAGELEQEESGQDS